MMRSAVRALLSAAHGAAPLAAAAQHAAHVLPVCSALVSRSMTAAPAQQQQQQQHQAQAGTDPQPQRDAHKQAQPQQAQPQSGAQQHAKFQATQQEEQQQQQDGSGSEPEQEQEQPLEGPGGVLQEWRVASAEWYARSVVTALQLHLSSPQMSAWSRYFHHREPGLLSRLLFPGGCSAWTYSLRYFVYADHARVAGFLLSEAHADYDSDAFRAGVKQAIEYTLELYAARDWAGLPPLVSASLLDSMKLMSQLQGRVTEATGWSVHDVAWDIDEGSVQPVCAHALTRQQLAPLDAARAAEQLPLVPVGADDEESATVDPKAAAFAGAMTGAAAAPVAEGAADNAVWDAVHVYASGTLSVSVQQPGGSAATRLSIPKCGHVVLCRGPVHVERVLQADEAAHKPWFLLCWL